VAFLSLYVVPYGSALLFIYCTSQPTDLCVTIAQKDLLARVVPGVRMGPVTESLQGVLFRTVAFGFGFERPFIAKGHAKIKMKSPTILHGEKSATTPTRAEGLLKAEDEDRNRGGVLMLLLSLST